VAIIDLTTLSHRTVKSRSQPTLRSGCAIYSNLYTKSDLLSIRPSHTFRAQYQTIVDLMKRVHLDTGGVRLPSSLNPNNPNLLEGGGDLALSLFSQATIGPPFSPTKTPTFSNCIGTVDHPAGTKKRSWMPLSFLHDTTPSESNHTFDSNARMTTGRPASEPRQIIK
jgi:hypothetical protein